MRAPQHPLSSRSAVFAGCVRDCECYLPGVLENLEALSSLFRQSAFVLVENDSKDNTKSILRRWGTGRQGFYLHSLDRLDERHPSRTVRLAEARNTYIQTIKTSQLRTFEYLFVLDFDNVSEMPLDLHMVTRAIDFLDGDASCAGVFANQRDYYYDLWALRHPDLCPGDIWLDILDHAETWGVSDDEAFERVFRPRIFALPPDREPIEVESCFGGLGIYKMSSTVLDGAYHGTAKATIRPRSGPTMSLTVQACEHVTFNRSIVTTGGRLFILPYLINGTTRDMNYPPSDCRTIVIDAAALNARPSVQPPPDAAKEACL
jgi:hypothetical protein